MNCPNCNRMLRAQATTCRHCGTKIVRKSDKLIRKMTLNRRIAQACGGLLIIIAIIIGFYGAFGMAAISAGIGATLIIIGKFMR